MFALILLSGAFDILPVFPAYAGAILGGGAQVSLSHGVTAAEFSDFLSNYKGLALFIAGLCTITAIIMFVISISKLSLSADNDQMRRKAWMGIIVSGISIALIGGVSVVVGMFWHFLS